MYSVFNAQLQVLSVTQRCFKPTLATRLMAHFVLVSATLPHRFRLTTIFIIAKHTATLQDSFDIHIRCKRFLPGREEADGSSPLHTTADERSLLLIGKLVTGSLDHIRSFNEGCFASD